MGKHLKNSLKYILNPEKTRMGTLIGGNHVLPDPEYAFQQMLDTKKVMDTRYGYKKMEGRQGYHFVLSFSPKDSVTPEMALEITEEFVKAYIPDYESVFAVHDNTDIIHSHIVFNSVDMVRGSKFHTKNTEWEKRLQPIVNQLCEEYGLSTIDIPDMDRKAQEPSLEETMSDVCKEKQNKNKNYAQWKEEKEAKKTGKKSEYDLFMDEVWECLYLVKSRQEFDQEMKKRGYKVTRKKKNGGDLVHTSVLRPGKTRNTRLNKEQEAFFQNLPEECSRKRKRKKKTVQEERSPQITKLVLANTSHPIVKKERIDRMDGSTKEEGDSENPQYQEKWYENKRNIGGRRNNKTKVPVKSGMKKIVHARKMQHNSLVIQTLSMRYILYDYRKRKYGKYYREYVKFSAIQKKVKYLHANKIKTLEQLEQRREELRCLQDKLQIKKKEIFQERKQYAKVFRLYGELEKLRLPVELYRDGDNTFSNEYNKMKEIIEQIKKAGLSVSEVQEQYVEYKQRLSSLGKIERMAQKEAALCEELWQENCFAKCKEEDLTRKKERKTKKVR